MRSPPAGPRWRMLFWVRSSSKEEEEGVRLCFGVTCSRLVCTTHVKYDTMGDTAVVPTH
jgi:hypothetical protein